MKPAVQSVAASASRPEAASAAVSGRLGEILVSRGLISEAQLDEALGVQQEKKGRLGEILLGKKVLAEADLYQALSDQLGIPCVGQFDPQQFEEALVQRLNINFSKRFGLLPLRSRGRFVQVLTSDPLAYEPLDALAVLYGRPIEPLLAAPSFVLDMTNYIYDRVTTLMGGEMENVKDEDELDAAEHELEEITDLLDATDEAPIIRYVNQLLYQAVKERASDIHIEPQEKEMTVRFRIDGILYVKGRPHRRFQNPIISRVKVMAQLDIAEKRLPQDGRIRIKIAGRDIDIRVSTIPTQYGEKVVMRLLDKTNILLDLEDLGMPEDRLSTINRIINKSHGIVLVTGPTGSGKTTTLYACLNKINSPEINITTVEDPVEYELKGIQQIQVNDKIHLSFANGLRSILRQDPDVIMVGEIRDPETAEMAIQASLTGHLVFSTLHTNDAAGAVARLVDMNVEPFLIASTLIAVVAQRLVRTVCPECVEWREPTDQELEELGLTRRQLKNGRAPHGRGCTSCAGTGYRGRQGIYEILLIDDEMQKLITARASSNETKKLALQKGMLTLRQDGARKVASGITTVEEVLRVTQEETFEVL